MSERRLIYADALSLGIKLALKHLDVGESDWLNGYVDGLDATKDLIKQAPTVDAVEVVHGRWERGIAYFMCSECRKDAPISSLTSKQYKANYCPNCGAKMDGDGNEA